MTTYHPYTIFPLGDSALTIEFSDKIDIGINEKLMKLFRQLQAARLPAVTDLIPAYGSLTVCYDVSRLHRSDTTAFETMASIIEELAPGKMETQDAPRLIKIPVCYDSAYAPDTGKIAAGKKISPEEIIAIHTSRRYRVFMLGFLPGFAYMGELDERIAFPRKPAPSRVSAGSVGIAGRQTGIYPLDSPGGWQIIGRTPITLFDPARPEPALFQPGDEVLFFSIGSNEFENYQRRPA